MIPVSNTQFHQKLDQFMLEGPKKNIEAIQKLLHEHIQVISSEDARIYLPKIRAKLLEVDIHHPVVEEIETLCQTLLSGRHIAGMPPYVREMMLFSGVKMSDRKGIIRTSQLFHDLATPGQALAYLLADPQSIQIPLEKRLEFAQKAKGLVTTLHLSSSELTDGRVQEFLAACPNIERLFLGSDITDAAVANLPRSLKYLSLNCCRQITNAGLQNLPPGLQELDIRGCSRLTDAVIPSLPCNLKSLGLGDPDYENGDDLFTDAAIRDLPPNLEELSLCSPNMTKGVIKILPRTLKVLDLTWMYTRLIEDDSVKDLPPNLTKLIMSHADNLTDAGVADLPRLLEVLQMYGRNLTNGAVAHLPRTLKKLILSNIDQWVEEPITNWPPALKILGLPLSKSLIDGTCLKDLPPSVEELFLGQCPNLNGHIVKNLPRNIKFLNMAYSPQLPKETIQDLPRKLIEFYCSGFSSQILDEADIRNLPRTLQRFELHGNSRITHVKELPLDLKVLILHGQAQLTDALMKDLPRGLEELDMGQSDQLTDVGIKDLPRNLIRLKVSGCSQLTKASLKDFPRNLIRLDLHHSLEKSLTEREYLSLPSSPFRSR
jgi:hypothetical protein